MLRKVCPVVYRIDGGCVEVLAFKHPSAGRQLIKGTIEHGELPRNAACRELREESGITNSAPLIDFGQAVIGEPAAAWHFYGIEIGGLPERWDHQTEDDLGHIFSFFWHPLDDDLDDEWHPIFHDALRVIRRSLQFRSTDLVS